MPINDTQNWASRKRLIELLGEAGAARLIEVFGGSVFRAPKPEWDSFKHLAAALGPEQALKFCQQFGDTVVTIPLRLFSTRDQILKLSETHSVREIVRELRCSERYVYLVLQRSDK